LSFFVKQSCLCFFGNKPCIIRFLLTVVSKMFNASLKSNSIKINSLVRITVCSSGLKRARQQLNHRHAQHFTSLPCPRPFIATFGMDKHTKTSPCRRGQDDICSMGKGKYVRFEYEESQTNTNHYIQLCFTCVPIWKGVEWIKILS